MITRNRTTDKMEDLAEIRQRATASAIVCSLVIIAFISVGLLSMTAQFLGKTIEIPGEWLAAMLSLASTSLGFLAGEKRKDDNKKNDVGCCQHCNPPKKVGHSDD